MKPSAVVRKNGRPPYLSVHSVRTLAKAGPRPGRLALDGPQGMTGWHPRLQINEGQHANLGLSSSAHSLNLPPVSFILSPLHPSPGNFCGSFSAAC